MTAITDTPAESPYAAPSGTGGREQRQCGGRRLAPSPCAVASDIVRPQDNRKGKPGMPPCHFSPRPAMTWPVQRRHPKWALGAGTSRPDPASRIVNVFPAEVGDEVNGYLVDTPERTRMLLWQRTRARMGPPFHSAVPLPSLFVGVR